MLCGVATGEADTPELNQVITPSLYMVVVVYGVVVGKLQPSVIRTR